MGAFGDAHPRATVTEDQVRQIIQLLQSRKTQKEVARQFGVNRLVVEGIASGRNWQHVPRPANFDTTIRHRAKLTEDQVREIRHLLKAGHSQGGIAKRFDVVRTTIRDITTGRTGLVGRPFRPRRDRRARTIARSSWDVLTCAVC